MSKREHFAERYTRPREDFIMFDRVFKTLTLLLVLASSSGGQIVDRLTVTDAVSGSGGGIEQDGDLGITATTTGSWTYGIPLTRFRLSRPIYTPDDGSSRHFLITPYRWGLGMEYNGIIEVFSAAFSIHYNHEYNSYLSQYGQSAGGQLWVGDDMDTGGLYLTARKFGALNFSEIASSTFAHTPHGDLRLRVPDESVGFSFRVGGLEYAGYAPDEVFRIHGTGDVVFAGRVHFADLTDSKPPCDESKRLQLWSAAGAFGTADSVEICAKHADGTYSWRTVFEGG
jgi:hypothetical protein